MYQEPTQQISKSASWRFFSKTQKCTRRKISVARIRTRKNAAKGRVLRQGRDKGHYPYTDQNGDRMDLSRFPEINELNTPVLAPGFYDDAFGGTTGCGLDLPCTQLLSANYYDNGIDPFAAGDVVGLTLDIQSNYAFEHPSVTGLYPTINSGWRNPELEEALGFGFNTGHGRGRGVDLNIPKPIEIEGQYDGSNLTAAATRWCELMNGSYIEMQNQVLNGFWPTGAAQIENSDIPTLSQSSQGLLTITDDYYVLFSDPGNVGGPFDFADCTAEIQSRITVCVEDIQDNNLLAEISPASPESFCSPDHVHVSE